jgi:beta-glucosidase-like glycosyl hydrolase
LFVDLTGVGIAETIKGIQDAGVIACAKHFIGNEQVSHPAYLYSKFSWKL